MIPERAAKRERYGELTCAVYEAHCEPRLAVVLCHGYGAPGTDLVPLSWEVTARNPRLSDFVHWVFPAAPLHLDQVGAFDGRAWWHLDVSAFLMAVAAGHMDMWRQTVPEGLPTARQMLQRLVDQVLQHTGLSPQRLVLGGFSQGAMLATDVALRSELGPCALAVFSGTLIAENEWRDLAPRKKFVRVLQSHGRYDTILPFETGLWLKELFLQAGMTVEFVEFHGDHAIPEEVVDRFGNLLDQYVTDPS